MKRLLPYGLVLLGMAAYAALLKVMWPSWKEYQVLVTAFSSVAAMLLAAFFAWRQGIKQLRSAWLRTQQQLEDAERDRHSDLLMRFSERWESPWLRRGREAIWKMAKEKQNLGEAIDNYEETDVQEMLKLTSVGDFFEDMGFLAKNDYLKPLSLINALFGLSIEKYYRLYAPYIEKHRVDKVYDLFEWLANNIKKDES